MSKFVDISLDLHLFICTLLHPSDILALRKTCKTLELVTRQRTIWVDALRRVCWENVLFLPSFPILDMSDVEVEQAAIAPRRWNELATSFSARRISDPEVRLPPTTTRIIEDPFPSKQPTRLTLVPGGRYMVGFSESGLGVWDLGYTSSADCKLIALVGPEGGSVSGDVHATPDGMGLVICSLRLFGHCSFYEIYPQSETPQLTKIASLDLPPQYESYLPSYVVPGKMIWFYLNREQNRQPFFRVWDYRLNASVSFKALIDVEKIGGNAEVTATQTAIIILQEEEIFIWAIPPLRQAQPPDFDDFDLAQFPPAIRVRFPDGLSLRPPLASLNTMSSWYLHSSKPLYFDKVYSRHSQLQRFKIIIKPDFSDATLHFINTIQLPTDHFDRRAHSMFGEDTLISAWASLSKCSIYIGSTLSDPTLQGDPSMPRISLAVDRPLQLSICPASGRLVHFDCVRSTVRDIVHRIKKSHRERHTDNIVVLDFLPQRL